MPLVRILLSSLFCMVQSDILNWYMVTLIFSLNIQVTAFNLVQLLLSCMTHARAYDLISVPVWGSSLKGSPLKRSSLWGSLLGGSSLQGSFGGSSLGGSLLGKSSLKETLLRGSSLKGSLLGGSSITDRLLQDLLAQDLPFELPFCKNTKTWSKCDKYFLFSSIVISARLNVGASMRISWNKWQWNSVRNDVADCPNTTRVDFVNSTSVWIACSSV